MLWFAFKHSTDKHVIQAFFDELVETCFKDYEQFYNNGSKKYERAMSFQRGHGDRVHEFIPKKWKFISAIFWKQLWSVEKVQWKKQCQTTCTGHRYIDYIRDISIPFFSFIITQLCRCQRYLHTIQRMWCGESFLNEVFARVLVCCVLATDSFLSRDGAGKCVDM